MLLDPSSLALACAKATMALSTSESCSAGRLSHNISGRFFFFLGAMGGAGARADGGCLEVQGSDGISLSLSLSLFLSLCLSFFRYLFLYFLLSLFLSLSLSPSLSPSPRLYPPSPLP